MKSEPTNPWQTCVPQTELFVSSKAGLVALVAIYPLDTAGSATVCFPACQIIFVVHDSIDRDEQQGICVAIFGLN